MQPRSSLRKAGLRMQCSGEIVDRRTLLGAAAAIFAGFSSPLKYADAAGLAFGYGANENDINAQLLAYSLPPIDKVSFDMQSLLAFKLIESYTSRLLFDSFKFPVRFRGDTNRSFKPSEER